VFFTLLRAVIGNYTMCKKDACQTAMWCIGRHFKSPQLMAILTNKAFYKVFQKEVCEISHIGF
jgi:hypothetical protein